MSVGCIEERKARLAILLDWHGMCVKAHSVVQTHTRMMHTHAHVQITRTQLFIQSQCITLEGLLAPVEPSNKQTSLDFQATYLRSQVFYTCCRAWA
jgi:hypothetical protein